LQPRLDLTHRIITNHQLITKYNNEFKYKFFTPKSQYAWLDLDVINKHKLTKLRKIHGKAYNPILVAVNSNDPYMNHPLFRIHGRVINGRQRYEDSRNADQRWPVEYIQVTDFKEFVEWWSSMGEIKSQETISQQRTDMIKSFCDIIWKEKPEAICDTKGLAQKELVCSYVVKKLEDYYHPATIRKYVPQEYKEKFRIDNIRKRHQKKSPLSLKVIEQQRRIQELTHHIEELETRTLPDLKKAQMILEKERTIKRYKLLVGQLRTELKQTRRSLGIDKTDKDFEDYYAKYEMASVVYPT
jgi:hypothetical protein